MRYFLLCPLFLLVGLLTAQPEQLTERSLKEQEAFIEAKRQALLGKTDDAITRFTAIVEADPDNDAALFELARLQYAAEQTDDAIDALRRAYGQRPNEIYAAFLAELYQAAGRYRDGAALYADLIKDQPEEAEHYLQRAAFLVRAQDVKAAIGVYDDLEKRTGINAELARRKHALYLGLGDTKRAERELTELIAAFPRQLEYRHLLASYYTSQGEPGRAERTYRDILTIQPADVRAQLALQDATPARSSGAASGDDAALLTLLGRPDVAIDLKVGKLLPLVQEVATSNDRATADRALRLAAELRRVHPDDAKAAAIVGDLYYHSDRLPEAIEAYRSTVSLDDTVYPVWEQLLAALYLDNQSARLREYGEEALDIFPNRPAIYLYYALGEAFRGDFAAADNLLQQAQLMVSEDAGAAATLEAVQAAFKLLEAPEPAAPGLAPTALPGGERGPLYTYLRLRHRPDAAQLAALDRPTNTNALLLELMGDTLESADRAAAAALYARARAAGSKSPTLARKLARTKS